MKYDERFEHLVWESEIDLVGQVKDRIDHCVFNKKEYNPLASTPPLGPLLFYSDD